MFNRFVNFKMKLHNYSRFTDVFYIGIVSVFSIATRLLLLTTANVMYYFDSYSYFSSALKFLQLGIFPSYRSAYVTSLSGWLAIPNYFNADLLFSAKLFTVFISLILVCCVYLLFSKVVGRKFAFILSLLVSVEPVFLSFSVTSHNDIFYVLFGILTLYFSISKSKVLSLLVVPVFFVISCLTSEMDVRSSRSNITFSVFLKNCKIRD